MATSEEIEKYCRNCVSRDFVNGKGLVCKRTRELPAFEEECESFEKDEELERLAPPKPEDFPVSMTEEEMLAEENLSIVQAGVVVVGTLVVHAGHHGLDHLAVRKAQHTDLGAGEEFLHHHMVAGCAEFLIQHDLLHAVRSLLLVFADQHALAQGQTVGLDDHRVLALGLDVLHDLGGVVKGLVLCGGDAVFLHQVLGEHLGGLDAGSGLIRAKGRDAHCCQRIHHAQSQRVVLRHHNVIELFFYGKAHHGVHIGRLDVFALCVIADAAVAGCAPDLAAVRALFQCLDDGVLAAAAAHY